MPLRVCVGALLVSRQQILLTHRRADRAWYPNVWDIPGGHVESGETEAEALVRELREEVGIEVANPPDYPFRVIDGEGFRVMIWTITSWTGTPINRATNEHDDLRWVTLDELEDLLLAHPSYREVFRAALLTIATN
ncbi:MAG TPA: NUDIX domain-containing protein [Bryobacteraceae bacterium]|jgi:mutator protein MutT|nr:NUDIX domain-containing protein [Bryobacteraceae bacterium]